MQSLQVGDIVKFIDDDRSAKVINVFPDSTIEVEDELGIIERVNANEVVLASLEVAKEREKNIPQKKKNKKYEYQDTFLLKITKTGDILSFYLVNNSNLFAVGLVGSERSKNYVIPVKTVNMKDYSEEIVINVPVNKFYNYNKLLLNVIRYEPSEHKYNQSQIYRIKITTNKLINLLNGKLPEIVIPFKIVETKSTKKTEKIVYENVKLSDTIDLHAEKLLSPSEIQKYSNAELLSIQVSRFQSFLDKHLEAGSEKCTVVHGIGEGVLKSEIHNYLAKNPFVRSFEETSKGGATIIYFTTFGKLTEK